jgi:hypothetical protein
MKSGNVEKEEKTGDKEKKKRIIINISGEGQHEGKEQKELDRRKNKQERTKE